MMNITCDACWATIKDLVNDKTTGIINIKFNSIMDKSDMTLHVCGKCLVAKKRFWFEFDNARYIEIAEKETTDEQGH
jgi:hypothetical protein